MKIRTITENSLKMTIVQSDEIIVKDGQSALDLLATMFYEHECNCVIINKGAFCEEFFKLSSGIAGEVLQKVSNYHMKLAIVGDFSAYTSKPLRDFIYESNKTAQVLFVDTEEQAIQNFSGR